MQQKANEVVLQLNGEVITLEDVSIIETEDGIYVEDTFKLGTSDDGSDIIQKRLTYYRRENLLKLVWQENALVDSVKENVLAEIIQDKFEHLMEVYEDEEDEAESSDNRDNPKFDPYEKKE
tara:strand:- start:68 stop:430 length:363 start_codon:yes stop_codon:yes gene_type:complete